MMPKNNKIGYIPNAIDALNIDKELLLKHYHEHLKQLSELGFVVELLDLKEYFHKENDLRTKLNGLGAVWVQGGNTFVLRQAMKLSGFDTIFNELQKSEGFLYAGYSAGICVLSKSLKALHIVDKPNEFPYLGIKETLWNGLGFFNEILLPHYNSDHPESKDIDKTIKYCIENNELFIALRDGDVIIIE
jgi:dipeptidase E